MKKKIIKKSKTHKVDAENNQIIEKYEDLIDNNYLDFLKKQIEYEVWTPCQSKTFYKKFKNKEYLYPDSSSNIQLLTYIKDIKKHSISYWTRLYLLLVNFVSHEQLGIMINKIRNNPNISDREFVKLLENVGNKIPRKYMNITNKEDECAEKVYEFQNIYFRFKEIYREIHKNNFTKNIIKKTNFRYLDIGCGNGKKTILLSKIFNIPLSHTYGTDIKEWGPYQKSNQRKFDFHYKNIKEDSLLDFPDNSFELISCFFTLHHIPNLTKMIEEIKRVLVPNGLLLIIEHFVIDKKDALLIDLQHMLYSYLIDKKKTENYKNYIENPTFNRYFNVVEWDYILIKKHGFKYKHANILYSSTSFIPSYDNQYYGFYENIK